MNVLKERREFERKPSRFDGLVARAAAADISPILDVVSRDDSRIKSRESDDGIRLIENATGASGKTGNDKRKNEKEDH